MKAEVRQPQQERSIEKKKKIVEAGFKLFSEVGYYGTNTAEIAKEAGVSTGIVYGYFQDKRDILICVLDIYIDKVFEPLNELFDKLVAPVDYNSLLSDVIDITIKLHKKFSKIHQALHSLTGTDEVVLNRFISLEDSLTQKIYDKLFSCGEKFDNGIEKVHFAMDVVQSFAHESVFDKHKYIDYKIMRQIVIDSLVSLFTK